MLAGYHSILFMRPFKLTLFRLKYLPYLLTGFTGIDQEYEEPNHPDLIIEAGRISIDECVQQVVRLLQSQVSCTEPITVYIDVQGVFYVWDW